MLRMWDQFILTFKLRFPDSVLRGRLDILREAAVPRLRGAPPARAAHLLRHLRAQLHHVRADYL